MNTATMLSAAPAKLGVGDLRVFWWAFALRGGFAVVFACVLRLSAELLGTVFFDPIMLVSIALLLGSYVFGNGLLSGVAAIYARQHHLRVWPILAVEAVFAILLAGYIGLQLVLSSESIAWLAALHALGTGCFELAMAAKLREDKLFCGLLCGSGAVSLVGAVVFLLNRLEETRKLTIWLSGFELAFGLMVMILAWGLHRQVQSGAQPQTPDAIRTRA